jgi:hypothetical protein
MKYTRILLFSFLVFTSLAIGKDLLRLDDLLDPMPNLDTSIPAPHDLMKLEVGERHWYNHEIQ